MTKKHLQEKSSIAKEEVESERAKSFRELSVEGSQQRLKMDLEDGSQAPSQLAEKMSIENLGPHLAPEKSQTMLSESQKDCPSEYAKENEVPDRRGKKSTDKVQVKRKHLQHSDSYYYYFKSAFYIIHYYTGAVLHTYLPELKSIREWIQDVKVCLTSSKLLNILSRAIRHSLEHP